MHSFIEVANWIGSKLNLFLNYNQNPTKILKGHFEQSCRLKSYNEILLYKYFLRNISRVSGNVYDFSHSTTPKAAANGCLSTVQSTNFILMFPFTSILPTFLK